MPRIGSRESITSFRFRKTGSLHYFSSGINCGLHSHAQFADDRLYASPFYAVGNERFDRIAIHVSTAGNVGATARLGIYADKLIAPGRLVLDAGEVTLQPTGMKVITINIKLEKQLYWLAIFTGNITTPKPQLTADESVQMPTQFLGMDLNLNYWYFLVRRDLAYGVMPDPFGSPTLAGGSYAGVHLRKV